MAKLNKLTVIFESGSRVDPEAVNYKELADRLGFDAVDLVVDKRKRKREPIFVPVKNPSNLPFVVAMVISVAAVCVGLATMLL